MEDDWDLFAVVRGCAALTAAAPATSTIITSQNLSTFQFQDQHECKRGKTVQQELRDLFFPKSQDSSQLKFSPPISPPPVLVDLPTEHPPQQTELRPKPRSFSVSDVSKAHNPAPRTRRRKHHLKRVCHVSVENLSSDMWSWRKYGQKPIKGSPYPRGYYKCSTSKGCMARKQVERNRSDPGMFIVTYTAEHNHPMPTHRNSLAGSTRQKHASPDDLCKPSFSPEISAAASLSPAPEKLENCWEDLAENDDDLSVSKMALDDDFFAGLEDFMACDCSSGHFPANSQFPWLSSATTIA
ncbi:hypothetical protein ACS0TY_019777 [Phlomoides rotata]